MNPVWFEVSIVALFGLMIGSFLNVCMYRIPEEISIVSPRSKCPSCNKPIPWYDNIPVLSFILLGAKCRYCSKKISIQYPLIEIGFALILVHLYFHFHTHQGWQIELIYFGTLSASLLTATVIDLRYYIIPDEINLLGVIVGLLGAFMYPRLLNQSVHLGGLVQSLLGIAVGFGVLRLVVYLGAIVFRKEAMGLGDPKFLAMIGAFLGYKMVLLVIFISSLLGAGVGSLFVFLVRKDRKNTVIPYGPFLALGAYISLMYGDRLIQWYVGLFNWDY